MPLQPQNVDVAFSRGIDTKTSPNLVQAPMLLELQNAIFTEAGTLVKRNGYQPLGSSVVTGGTVTTGATLATYNNELLQVTSAGELYSYVQSQDGWIDRGAVSPLTIADEPVIRNSYTQSNPDVDSTGAAGVTVFAWEDTRGGVRACAIDETTGAQIIADTQISATAASPRVVACGTTICIVYADNSTLSMVTLNALAPTAFSSASILDTSMPASGTRIDAKAYDANALVVAWNFSGQTRVAFALATGVVGQPPNGYPSPVNVGIASTASVDVMWDATNARFWILGAGAGGLYGSTLTFGFVADLAPTQIDASAVVVNITAAVSGTTLTAYYEITGSQTYNQSIKSNTLSTAGTVGTASTGIRSVGLASKLFVYNSSRYFLVNFSSPLQPTTFLVNASTSTWSIVAKGQPFMSGGLLASGMVPKAFTTATGTWSVPSPTRVQVVNTASSTTGTNTTYTTYFLVGIDRLTLAFNGVDCFRSTQAGGNLLFTGGYIAMYDGQSVVEHGFHLFPEAFTAVASPAGGSMADGTYGITVVWYWQDAQGQIHRSAPGVPISVTVSGGGGSGSIALTIPTLRLTSKQGTRTAPIAAVFRTPVNGPFYQRVGNGAADAVTAPVYSTTTADTVAFSLTVADATIAANEPLYTQGGTLANVEPGGCALIAASGDRVFLAGVVGQPNTVLYSQSIVAGEPPEFCTQLYSTVDPRGGDLTAISVIDSNVILFKEPAVYAMTGEGPDFTGNNNSFTSPQLVSSDAGTVLPDTVVVMHEGLMFKSTKGIYRLDRALNLSYEGAPAEGFNSLSTTSGVTVDGVNQIRFTSSDGALLCYDYFFRQWSTFVNTSGTTPTFLAYDAIRWSRTPNALATYTYLNTAGTVLYETPGAYLDTYNPVAIFIRTAWLKLSSLQGFVKIPWVTVLGRFFSDHVLRVGLAYDFQGFTSEYHLFDSGLGMEVYGTDVYGRETPYGGVSNTVYQFRFRPDTMKCQSIQFTFAEQSPSNGEGFALSGMTLTAAVTPAPFRKLPAGQTIASS